MANSLELGPTTEINHGIRPPKYHGCFSRQVRTISHTPAYWWWRDSCTILTKLCIQSYHAASKISDRDESASLDEKEIQVLSYRLAHLDGVTVNKELLEEKLREDSSLAGVMAILQASTKKTVAAKDKVFLFGDEHAV